MRDSFTFALELLGDVVRNPAFAQEEIARQRNVDRERLAEVLSRYIPKIIDELTPSGQLQARR